MKENSWLHVNKMQSLMNNIWREMKQLEELTDELAPCRYFISDMKGALDDMMSFHDEFETSFVNYLDEVEGSDDDE